MARRHAQLAGIGSVATSPLLMGMTGINGISLTAIYWVTGFTVFFIVLTVMLSRLIQSDSGERRRYRRDAGDNAMFPYDRRNGDDDD